MVSLSGRLRCQDCFITRKVKMAGWLHYQEGQDCRMVLSPGRSRLQDGFVTRKVKMTGWFCHQEG